MKSISGLFMFFEAMFLLYVIMLLSEATFS